MSPNWQHKLEKIADRARNILQTGLWADCTFLVGIGDHRKEFKAHKLILSMSSAVFDKMLNGPLHENPDRIEVVDIQPEAFAALLKYIYTDEILIQSFDQACELCYVANKYMMTILVQHCISYIWKHINYTNACRAYEFAKLFDQHAITEDCKKIIFSQTSDVIEHHSFRDVEKDTLIMILDQDELNIKSESQLLEAVEKWIETEIERKGISDEGEKQILYGEIIGKIRFLSMKPQEFAEGPAVRPYISKDDSYAIIMNLVAPSPPVRLPKNFSEKKRVIGKGEKKETFCWELTDPEEMELAANTVDAVSIRCNKDIEIIGIKVMGRLLSNEEASRQQSLPHTVPSREKRIRGYIDNEHFTSTEHVIEKCSDGFRENINLLACKPFKMTNGKYYELGITILKRGWYNSGMPDYDSLIYKSLKFDIEASGWREMSSICGIIFKM